MRGRLSVSSIVGGALGTAILLLALTSSPRTAAVQPPPAASAEPQTVQTRALPSNEPARPVSAAEPKPVSLTMLFTIPVRGGVVPTDPLLLPGSQRSYRGGFHEGVDFPMRVGTPVYAAAPGRISRIDYAYQEWSEPAKNAALDNSRRLGYTPDIVLDLIRGRQVWVDHGDGIVTRYAHLSGVSGLQRGDVVDTTTVIGQVGSSGFPEGGPHLHFEIRLGDSYLGKDLDVPGVRAAVARAFTAESVPLVAR